MRVAAAVIGLLIATAAPLHAEVSWLDSVDQAVRAATTERKIILAQVGGRAASFLAEAEKHPIVSGEYGSFVLLRVDRLADPKIDAPIVVLDQTGAYVCSYREKDLDTFVQFLVGLRNETPLILAAADTRGRDDAAADFELGQIVFRFRAFARARELFVSAQRKWEHRGTKDGAELAEISSIFAMYFVRSDIVVRANLAESLRHLTERAKTAENRANGYYCLALLSVNANDPRAANLWFRRAYEAAPAGSALREGMRQVLASRGLVTERKGDTTLRIVAPQSDTISGRARFSIEGSRPIARVAWFLDGAAVSSTRAAPFQATLSLGDVPRLHTVRAVAYDAEGTQFAEASLNVNDRLDAFRIAIVSPPAESTSGHVSFEADAQVPPGRKLRKVELYHGDRRVAELDAPPFRAEVDLPNQFTFLRAVATLDDGRTAEETRVVNGGSAYGEMVDVHAVTFPAMIEDRGGKRIEGLSAKDVAVHDDGRPVDFTFRDATGEPATIGLAIDASSSMGESLLATLEAAHAFIDAVVSDREQVFLMTFDDRSHLIHDTTSDAAALHKALRSIRPAGSTAIFDAITFGLQQFTGLGGKKALVIITDGQDLVSGQSSVAAMRMAQENGVPVYLVIPGGQQRRFALGAGLTSIAAATGGVFLDHPRAEDYPGIFTHIRDDVRGQYLISFVSPAKTPGAWRAVKIDVAAPEAVVRTVSGYFAR
jgi:VWFA-related protein